MTHEHKPVICYRDVSIYQGEAPVLNKVNFSIYQGEFVFLIGSTGSGKSSLLKTLYGELNIQSGKSVIADFDLSKLTLNDIPYLRRKLGIVFQDFQLLSDRSVEDNLTFVLEATSWKDKYSIQKRVSQVLLQVGLSGALKKMPHQLSGGEQQRLVIARAILNDPLILLADEPTGNLDPEIAEGIMSLFFNINKSGTAVLMATHNYSFIKKYPKRILKCFHGNLSEL